MAIARPPDAPYLPPSEDIYPSGDGKPMAETKLHREQMSYCCDALDFHFAHRSDVLVAGNDFIYYEEGNPKACISPDCYVVFGVPRRTRRSYFVWLEGRRLPDVIFEITSLKTKKEDLRKKRPLYEQWGVPEYFQFDPTGDYLKPRLQGLQMQNGQYVSMPYVAEGRVASAQLQLELVVEGERLKFYDPLRGEWLRTYAEAETQRIAAEQRAEQEFAARQREALRANEAEAELARLRAELAALRRQAEH